MIFRKSLYSSDPSMMATLPTCIGLVEVSPYKKVASIPEIDFTFGRFSWDMSLCINEVGFIHFLMKDRRGCLLIYYQEQNASNCRHGIEDGQQSTIKCLD